MHPPHFWHRFWTRLIWCCSEPDLKVHDVLASCRNWPPKLDFEPKTVERPNKNVFFPYIYTPLLVSKPPPPPKKPPPPKGGNFFQGGKKKPPPEGGLRPKAEEHFGVSAEGRRKFERVSAEGWRKFGISPPLPPYVCTNTLITQSIDEIA